MATLIKIKRETIRRNPRAGMTETSVSLGKTIFFKMEGANGLPDFLTEGETAFTSSRGWGDFSDDNYIEGYLRDDTFIEQLLKMDGVSISVDNNIQTYRHRPERSYFYEHEDAEVPCNECGKLVKLSDIIHDTVVTEDDEYPIEKCPRCGTVDSFEREYEDVEEVIQKEHLAPPMALD